MKWFRKPRNVALYTSIVSDLTPSVGASREFAKGCQTQESPSAVLEAGIAKLFAIHRAVLAATNNENDRMAILPAVHERFVAEFTATARQAEVSEQDLVDLIVRRLASYDALMDSSIPQWEYKLAQAVFENVTRQPPNTAVALIIGIPILKEMNATVDFLKKVLK